MKKSSPTSENASDNTSNTRADAKGLLDKLKAQSPEETGKGVQQVEGLTAKDVTARKRGLDVQWDKTVNRIKRASLWLLFFLVAIACVLTMLGFFYLLHKWIMTFSENPKELGRFLNTVYSSVILILATLFVENIFRGK